MTGPGFAGRDIARREFACLLPDYVYTPISWLRERYSFGFDFGTSKIVEWRLC